MMKAPVSKSDVKEVLITHQFKAPVELVFKAWTDPEQLINWYAPDGCTIEYKYIEVTEGGCFHSCIHDPIHGECWVKGLYHEVIKNEKLVFTMALSNRNGELIESTDAGKSEDWPKETITTVTFKADGEQTQITLHQTASEVEAKKSGAYQGWIKMFNRLNLLVDLDVTANK